MSVTYSIPSYKYNHPCSSSSSSPCSSSSFKFSQTTKTFTIIRSSNADGPLRRPGVPSLSKPAPPPSLNKPVSPSPSPSPLPTKSVSVVKDQSGVTTTEFQRKMAKELQEYFKQKKLEEATQQGPVFGWVAKNEIGNGRWAMFGFAVGMLTEFATGSDFVDQVKILLSNFGILDLE
ncbi:Light-harvesting complex-like protein ohp2 [Ranunculus cassubicifolius]